MQVLDRTGVGTLWSICKTKFALAGHAHNSLAAVGNELISATAYGSGLHFKPYYSSGGPTIYGNILEYTSTNTGGGQLAMEWTGSQTKSDGTDSNVGRVYYRSKRDCINGWTKWMTLAYTNDIPTKLSLLTNDKGFVTGSVSGNTITINGASTTWSNTWRGIQDNLTSTSTSESLSANLGRILKGLVDGKANSSHTHSWSLISGTPATATRWPSWGEVTGKPGSFTPSSHTHDWSLVTGKPDLEYIVPTLPNIPTSSTLTFVENGVTKHFKIGYMCRVADSSAKYGYKFYLLYNISGNNAVWGEVVGGGGDYDEKVIVTLKSSVSASDSKLNGVIITVKNKTTNLVYTLTWNGTPLVFKIPAVNTYTVSASRVSGYNTPAELSYTAGVGTSRDVVIAYKYIPFGIYIYDTDGNFTKANDWNTANNGKAVGVAVRTENSAFVIAPTANSEKKKWGCYDTTISGIVTTNDTAMAKMDYAGEANTDKIIAQLGIGNAPAAEYCRSLTFKNGKKGYLWSLGEAQDAYKNQAAIDAAMRKIGGTDITTTVYLWTSTQYSTFDAWILYWNNGYVSCYYKNNNYDVRAVCAF